MTPTAGKPSWKDTNAGETADLSSVLLWIVAGRSPANRQSDRPSAAVKVQHLARDRLVGHQELARPRDFSQPWWNT